MTLRRRALLLIGGIVLTAVFAMSALLASVLLPRIAALESQRARDKMGLVSHLLDDEREKLEILLWDWAVWTETYTFVQGQNPTYVEQNIADTMFASVHLSVIVFVDLDGQIIYGAEYDRETQQRFALTQDWEVYASAGSPLLVDDDPQASISGFLTSSGKLYVVAARSILTSDGEGPRQGTLIMARQMDARFVDDLADRAILPIEFLRVGDADLPSDLLASSDRLGRSEPITVRTLDRERLATYLWLPMLDGQQSWVVRAIMPREIYAQGVLSLTVLVIFAVLTGVVFGLTGLSLLERGVLAPLFRVTSFVEGVRRTGNLSARLQMAEEGEIAGLGRAIDAMLSELEVSHQELQESEWRFRQILRQMPLPVLVCDSSGLAVYANPRFLEEFGLADAAGVIGEYNLLKDAAMRHLGLRTALHQVFGGEPAFISDLQVPPEVKLGWDPEPRNEPRLYQLTMFPVLLDSGMIWRVVTIWDNVTSRRSAEAALRKLQLRFQAIYDAANALILADDWMGNVVYMNPYACEVLGYAPGEFDGQSIGPLFERREARKVQEMRQQLADAPDQPITGVEQSLRRKDGRQVIVRWNITALRDSEGRAIGVLRVGLDVTEQREMEDQLLQSEQRYKTIFEFAPEGITTVDLKGFVTSCNPAFEKLSGLDPSEVVGKHFTQLSVLYPQDLPGYLGLFAAILQGKVDKPIPFRWMRKDGSQRWGEAQTSLLRIADRLVGMQAIIRDVTEERRARRLLEALNRAVQMMEPALTLDAVFSAVSRVFRGVGIICGLFVLDETGASVRISAARNRLSFTEILDTTDAGHIQQAHIALDAVPPLREMLAKREALFIDSNSEGAWPGGGQDPAARRVVETLRLGRLVMAPLTIQEQIIGAFSVQADDLTRDDVPTFTAFANQVAMAWQKARLLAQLQQELTERRRAEEEVRRLQGLLQDVADSMPSALVTLGTAAVVLTWNPAAEKLLGRSQAEALGRSLWEVSPNLRRYFAHVARVLTQQQPVRLQREAVETEQGTHYWDVEIFPLSEAVSGGAVLRVEDVTQRVHFETMMLQSAKMVSIGGLAAGLAHELNNPLAVMVQSAQMLELAFDVDRPTTEQRLRAMGIDPQALRAYLDARGLNEYLAGIRTSGERAAKIVSDLVTYSGEEAAISDTCILNDLVEDTLTLMASDYDLTRQYDFREIMIVREFDPGLPAITCDRQQIQQVIFNLVRNAAQAMAGNASAGQRISPRLVLRTSRHTDWVRLEIEDNGPGVPAQVRERLFEPFVTTREVGEGTGLGLWLSWSIVVERHRGRVWVDSIAPDSSGKGQPSGTRVVLELPTDAANGERFDVL